MRMLSKVLKTLGLLTFTLWACLTPRLGFTATTTIISGDCDAAGLIKSGAWTELTRREPRLQEILDNIHNQSNDLPEDRVDVPMTNCVVSWPLDQNDKAVVGTREVIMDRMWSNDGGKTDYHGGFRFSYEYNWASVIWPYKLRDGRADHLVRRITGFSYCLSDEACNYLGIPFRSEKERKLVESRKGSPAKLAQKESNRF